MVGGSPRKTELLDGKRRLKIERKKKIPQKSKIDSPTLY